MVVWTVTVLRVLGPWNLLWICDLANIIILVAIWRENALLFSSQLVAVLLVDVLWTIDVVGKVILGEHLIGGTEYMFMAEIPAFARGLSLFHVFVPALLLWMVIKLGYDRRGYYLQMILTWFLIPFTYVLSPAERNINWVHQPFGKPQDIVDPRLYVAFLMIAYPLVVYLPSHLFALNLFGSKIRDQKQRSISA